MYYLCKRNQYILNMENNKNEMRLDEAYLREQFNRLLRGNLQTIKNDLLTEKHGEEEFAAVASAFLRMMRESAGFKQSELSERIGAAPNYISRVESGAVQPSVGRFLAILYSMGFDMVPEVRNDATVNVKMESNGYSFTLSGFDEE